MGRSYARQHKERFWLDQLFDLYDRLNPDERAVVFAFAVIVFLLVLAFVLANPIKAAVGSGIVFVVGGLVWVQTKAPGRMRPENILAVGAVSVSLILAGGIVSHAVDLASGGAVITTLVGGSTISKVIVSRMRVRKTID
jgi:hypothetical protein